MPLTLPQPNALPYIPRDAQQTFEILRNGGLTIIPVNVGYAIVATSPVALERAFVTKQRGAHKRHAMIGSYALHKEIHTLPEEEQSVVELLTQTLDLPLAVIAPLREEHPIVKALGKETLERSSVEGTLAMAINFGTFQNALSILCTEAGLPLMGSSANLTGKGTKSTAWEIEPEILAAADVVVDYGKQMYSYPRTSSTMIKLGGPVQGFVELMRFGACYEIIREAVLRFYGVDLGDDPGKEVTFSGHVGENLKAVGS